MRGREPPLVGREAELRVIDETLDALDGAGAVAVLRVGGGPGIGKSRLLHELSAQGEARRRLVLAGRAAEFETESPFGMFEAALDDRCCKPAPSVCRTWPAAWHQIWPPCPCPRAPHAGAASADAARALRAHRAVRAMGASTSCRLGCLRRTGF